MDTWHLSGNTARCDTGGWQAEFQFAQPRRGLHRLSSSDGTPMFEAEEQLLGIDVAGFADPIPETQRGEHYVRQCDLVVSYEHPEPDHMRQQVDWRILDGLSDIGSDTDTNIDSATSKTDKFGQSQPARRCHGAQLLVSLSTNRLDGRPKMAVVSRMFADEVLSLAASAAADSDALSDLPRAAGHSVVMFRRDGSKWSWVHLAYPSDLVRVELTSSDTGACELVYRLLDEHLEKGVIRRVQLAVWRVPREDDRRLARLLFQRFVTSPPPISA